MTRAVEAKSVVANGARLYYERQGTGPAVFFIAGSTGDAGNFSRAAELLADEFTVLTYDRRGNSRSPPPSGWTTTSVKEQADDAAALINILNLTREETVSYLVNSIGHVQVNVTDMEAVIRDATDILGLHVTRRTGDTTWLSSNGRQAELVLHSADANAARLIGFEAVSADAVKEAARRVPQAGCQLISEKPTLDCCAAGMVFATPQGHTFEVHTPIPDDINNRRHYSVGVGALRIDHVNIVSPEPAETRSQVETILGLRLSERMVDDGLSWMRGANQLHHILGIVRGKTGLHHYSFEFADFGDYCRLGDLLDRADNELIWGPGRHRPGDNTYAYYIDSSGAMIECSSGMAIIADDDNYEPNIITALKRPENVRVMNVWGTPAPAPWLSHTFPFAQPPVPV